MLNQLLLKTFIQKREEDIKGFNWLLDRGKTSNIRLLKSEIEKKKQEIAEAKRFLLEEYK